MAELATVARPYAEALFRVAQNRRHGGLVRHRAELAQIGANPDVQALRHNPNVTPAQLAETFASLVKSPLNAEANNFIAMLAENGRVACCRKSAPSSPC
jgi:F-type H+-transporting ATPase subunit delta